MSKLVTKKRTKWAAPRGAVLKGHPLAYSAPAQERYVKALQSLTRQMTQQTQREIERLFRSQTGKEYFAQDATISSQARILTNELIQRFEQLFGRKAKKLAERMVNESDKASTFQLHSSLKELSGGLSLKTSVLTGPMKEAMYAATVENTALIKSIPAQYLSGVQGAVMRSITSGNGLADLVPYLQKHEGMTLRRAKNIALDQTRKTYSAINTARMKKIGVKKFEWIHSAGGQNPRQDHLDMDGKIYSFDDPPIIDSNTGERGFPGQLINCRCQSRPVIDFGEEEDDSQTD